MKKIVSAMLCLALIFAFAGCGAQSESRAGSASSALSANSETSNTAAPPAQPLDLTGNWKQDGASSDAFQAGYITENRIEIFWITEGGAQSSLYWSGSYVAPTTAEGQYSWSSKNDTSRTGSAMLASGDDEKEFTYQDGKLSYSVSAFGTTTTMVLVPTDEDYVALGGAYAHIDADLETVPAVLIDSGYTVTTSQSRAYISYAVEIQNPNEFHAIHYPKIRITARSADGAILSNEEQTLSVIAAGDTILYGNTVSYEGSAPDTVDITVISGDKTYDFELQEGSSILHFEDLQTKNISMIEKRIGASFTGEITNQSDIDLSMFAIIVIYRLDGQIVGGEAGYGDALKAGETAPFEINIYTTLPADAFDSYEIHAIQWL